MTNRIDRSTSPPLNRPQMRDLVGDLLRHRRGPRRAAAAFYVDFHPEGFPAPRRPDTVHGRRPLDAPCMRGVEEHERLFAARYLFDFLPQHAAILHDRLVGSAEMFAGAILDRAHRFPPPLVVDI